MRNIIRHITVAVVAMVALMYCEECFAQKYPERRTTRQGNKAYNSGNYSEAEVKYRKALAENKELWQADYNLANATYKQERYNDAAKMWQRVAEDSLRTESEKAEALFNVGNALFSERKFEEAIEAYKSSLRLVPSDTECKFNLAYAQKMLQEQQNQQQQEQNDQNQDQNQNQDQQNDQNQDKNNDNNQDQNQDKNGNDNRDQQNKDQEPHGDNKDDKQNDQKQNPQGEKPQPQNGQQPRMSQQQADQLLQAIQGEEDKTRDKMDKQKAVAVGRSGKNW